MTEAFLDTENGESASLPAPNVCIVLLTYLRTAMALATIDGVAANLGYPLEKILWYIADDGSPAEHVQKLQDRIDIHHHNLYGYHNESFAERPNCGFGWNVALKKAHEVADIVLWLEDDWRLERRMDIRPYVRLLVEREDVGMVSMRTLAVGSDVHTVGYRGIHYLKYLRSTDMAYSGNPLLRHIRFTNHYGFFGTRLTPGNIELNYDEKYRTYPPGPDIWRPVDIGGWGIWGHIGERRTW